MYRNLLLFSIFQSCIFSPSWAEGFLSDEDLYGEDIEFESSVIYDPLETYNRVVFNFNDLFFNAVIHPIAVGYTAITPDKAEIGAKNFFNNLRYPIRLVGNLLQGKFFGAWVETGRFTVNSTLGLCGVMSPSDKIESLARVPSEDFGQALGAYGMTEGPYLVMPIFGPTNFRDLLGLFGDRALNPFVQPWTIIDSRDWRLAYGAGRTVVNSPEISERYLQMKGNAIDPYGALKSAYTQYRNSAIQE